MAAYVFIDVSHKQEFIYKNNKLKDNLYNSFIIKSVTEKIKDLATNEEYCEVTLSGYLDNIFCKKYDFVYSGGGNSIIKFESQSEAQDFVKGYSREILKAFPDLEMYISIVDESDVANSDDKNKEKDIRDELHKKADKLKDKRKSRFKRWSYGVEKIDETGKPMPTEKNNRDYKLAKYYLHQNIKPQLESEGIIITDDLDDYKKDSEGKSYIGVIVIDGNKMGDMVNRISSFEQLRHFSEAIESIYQQAVIKALTSFKATLDKQNETKNKNKAPQKLYVTPIVMAGDDICLIIDAEYAIATATEIVQQIEELSKSQKYQNSLQVISEKDTSLKACAGVAITKHKHPFFEAVKTAETLNHQAKEAIYQIDGENARNASFIDWEVIQGPVKVTHEYENYVKHGHIIERYHLKPLRIDQGNPIENGIYSYASFIQMVDEISKAIANRKETAKMKDENEKKISNSALEQIKKLIYSGWDQYKLFFEMQQIDDYNNLDLIVKEIYHNQNISSAAVVETKDDQSTVYTYVLNDVLDVLPFINRERGE